MTRKRLRAPVMEISPPEGRIIDLLMAALREIAEGCANFEVVDLDYHKNRTKEEIENIAKDAMAKALEMM